MLRATISIPSNIAEGSGRGSNPDFRRFLWHSLGSCNELEYDLQLACDLKILPVDRHAGLGLQVASSTHVDRTRGTFEEIAIGARPARHGNWELATGNWQLTPTDRRPFYEGLRRSEP